MLWPVLPGILKPPPSLVGETARRVFFYAKLRPRVLFAAGAALRALQLSTNGKMLFDPTAGVGAGLNLLALFAGSRWPASVICGWIWSKSFWQALGARPPAGVTIPISVSIDRGPGKRGWPWQSERSGDATARGAGHGEAKIERGNSNAGAVWKRLSI